MSKTTKKKTIKSNQLKDCSLDIMQAIDASKLNTVAKAKREYARALKKCETKVINEAKIKAVEAGKKGAKCPPGYTKSCPAPAPCTCEPKPKAKPRAPKPKTKKAKADPKIKKK